ncbi:MAG: hypothetical protein V8R52_13585 [Coprobacter fastidiosus]
MEERETMAVHRSFDFVQRVNLNACNKKNIESLALSGGFRQFSGNKKENNISLKTVKVKFSSNPCSLR